MNEDDKTLALHLAISTLAENGNWPTFEAAIRERREDWIRDTRDPRIYHNHAELTSVMAHVAECDWLLELISDSKPSSSQ